MIRIKINHTDLDLDANTKIRWEENNSFFSRDSITAPFSFNFDVPATKRNKILFENADIIEVVNKCPSYGATLLLDGHLFFEGDIVLENTLYDTKYRLRFKQKSLLPDLTLDEVDFGGPVNEDIGDGYTDLPQFPSWYNDRSYPEAPFYFPYIENEHVAPGYFINEVTTAAYTSGNYCPFLYLKYVLDTIAGHKNLNVDGLFFTDEEIQDLLIYNNRYLVYQTPLPTFFQTLDPKNHLPRITAAEMLLKLSNMFCLGIYIHKNQLIITDFKSMINSEIQNDWSGKDHLFYETEFDSADGYLVEFTKDTTDENTELIKEFEGGVYLGEVDDITAPIGNIDEYIRSKEDNAYIMSDGISWNIWLSYDLTKVTSSAEECSAVTAADTPLIKKQDRIWVKQPFNTAPEDPGNYNPFGFRLVFRRGWHIADDGQERPLASGLEYNNALDDIGNYVLDPGHPIKGTYQVWWKDFIDMCLCNKTIVVKLDLNLLDVINFKRDSLIKIGRTAYVWKKIEFVFGMSGIEEARGYLVKI